MTRKLLLPLVVLILAAGGVAYVKWSRPTALVLTGIVTTNDVVVSPQIAGQISQLLIAEGDQVKKEQLLAVITHDHLKALPGPRPGLRIPKWRCGISSFRRPIRFGRSDPL